MTNDRLIFLREIENLKRERDFYCRENGTMRELVSRWLIFSGDVRPSCLAGEEWLGILKADTTRAVERKIPLDMDDLQ